MISAIFIDFKLFDILTRIIPWCSYGSAAIPGEEKNIMQGFDVLNSRFLVELSGL